KLTCGDVRPIERSGEQDIEIEEGKRRNQEIRLVGTPKLHRFDPLAFQQKDPGQNHSQQENDRQGSKILWHGRLLRSLGDGQAWLSTNLPPHVTRRARGPAARGRFIFLRACRSLVRD